jgi:anti-sigma factor RsiW
MAMQLSSAPVVEEELHAFVDGALDANRRKEVQDHLDRNPEAAALVTKFAAQRQLLRSALAPIADEPVPERLTIASSMARRRASRSWGWQIAAALLLSLGTGTFGGWQMRAAWQPTGGISVLAGEARSSFTAYAMDPVEVADKSALVSLVSQKLKRPVEIPDLSQSGYHYMGGRLVATGHGPAGLFFYDRTDGTRVALMIRPMAHEKEAPMMEQSAGNLGGFSWAARGLGYSVVGTEPPNLLHPVADEVRRQATAKPTT